MRKRWLFLLSLLGSVGCSSSTPVVVLRDHSFRVEIADDDGERSRGLMYRDHLDADAGMLFLFDRQEPQAFWMKNTRIPLDILYFDQSWSLVGWSLNTPPCSLGNNCPSYPSRAPARYVLELNAGTAGAIGAQLGDVLEVGAIAADGSD